MEVEVRKSSHVTMSRWDPRDMTLDQIGYAYVDAFLSFEIGRRLRAAQATSSLCRQVLASASQSAPTSSTTRSSVFSLSARTEERGHRR
ncbi:hypothetical protein ACMD2_25777 [Ananas comosus]|uniref:Uncharacterized protein n=1 Tax=Ananas comosus TaxID=4615 RepID=A0A199VFG5_ANACO|nr:hypothetical protein ACMD2_25777 [Ananas comosus]